MRTTYFNYLMTGLAITPPLEQLKTRILRRYLKRRGNILTITTILNLILIIE